MWLAAWLVLTLAAAPNPVTNGSFEALGDDGAATDWSHVGETVDYPAAGRTGERAMRLRRAAGQEGEVGFNRAWQPLAGGQGTMLAERKGALVFWYQVVALDGAEMQFMAIPMNDEPYERTGAARRIVTVPASHAGDGEWHRAALAYDFTGVPDCRWIHVSGRLQGPGAGEVLIDDIEYLPSIGPLPQVTGLRVVAAPDDRFAGGSLTAIITNQGDAPCGAVALEVDPPAGLTAGPADRTVAGLGPDQFLRITWPLTGERRAGAITVTARSGEVVSSERLPLAPSLRLTAVLLEPNRVVAGEPVEVSVTVENVGNAAAEAQVIGQPFGFEPAGPTILSGRADDADPRRTVYTWPLRAARLGNQRLDIRLLDGDEEVERAEVPVRVVRRLGADWQVLVPGLEVAPSPDGAVGRLVYNGRTLAELPHLGEVTYQAGGARQTVRPTEFSHAGGDLVATVRDPHGGTWTFKLFARPSDLPGATRVTSIIRCDRPRAVTALHGIDLLVPGSREEALLPGLEWLAPGEFSGSDLDIEWSHPERRRLTPHPNRVTIPYAAVATDDSVVGLLWDAHEVWARRLDRPQPVFDSPARATHQTASRLGLMAPNVPGGLTENELQAATPLRLAAGEPVTLRAHLYAQPEPDSPLAVQAAWLRLYQPEPSLPYPRGDAETELALCARALLDTLWDDETQLWWPFLLGPSVMKVPSRTPVNAWNLHAFAELLPNHPLAARARERVALVEQLESRPYSAIEDYGYLTGDPLNDVESRISAGAGQLASREEWGGWSFKPPLMNAGVFKGADYLDLGEPGMRANGLFARRVMDALRPARLVGADELVADALPSLDALSGFTVPRAAQVWEVPVHTPDILAAAEACEAFCEAYQLTGDQRWLDLAREQAYGGLAFCYLWNEAGKPWMRYGSIPVFGATWFRHSWLGNLVQWNGLAYAEALLLLDRLDDEPPPLGGLSWRDIARGIMVSAMYQQRTDDEELYGLWPDSLHTITELRAAWEFAPYRILTIHHELLGRPERPRTVLLTEGEESTEPLARDARGDAASITISSPAEITAASWQGETIRLTFTQPAAPLPVRATVAGLTAPEAVLVEGRPVEPVDTLHGLGEPCYRYHTAGRAVGLVLPAAPSCTVELRGVRAERGVWRAPLVESIDFGFDTSSEGWRPHHHLTEPIVRDGALHLRTTGGDPYLVRDGCRIDGDTVARLRVRLSVAGAGEGQLYWTTAAHPAYDEAKVLQFAVPPGGELREVVIEVGEHPFWRGQTITGLRLDPVNGGTGIAVVVESIIGER